nr:glycerol kinase GlpK [uncultured Porphyromonas sp.]
MEKYYLGLDQGTTGTTALIFDSQWNQVARGYKEHTQYYPQPGWVEHDPMEIWGSILETIDSAAKEAGIQVADLTCMGLDNQGETVMLWDRFTGVPVYNAIVWQDRRTAKMADEIAEQYGDMIREKTGLVVDAYFSAPKIRWIMDHVDGVREKIENGHVIAGTLDTWMIWKLTNGKEFVTDCVTASRTCLMNLERQEWDEQLLSILEIPREILPEIRENAGFFGKTSPETFLDAEIPITASIADQQAALLGQACCTPGSVKTTYGTGCFMLMNTGSRPFPVQNGLLSTLAWVEQGKANYALDGGIYIAGAAVQWLRDGLGIIQSAAQADAMALSVPDNGGISFVPAFSGLAAPYWDSYARGTITGITAGVKAEHLARATLEAEAYQVRDILKLLEQSTDMHILSMRVDGGGTASRFLMQFQADLLGIPVEIPVIQETTALGSAYMAALGLGDLSRIEDTIDLWHCHKRYEPGMSEDCRDALMDQWYRAVERSRGWITPNS